MKKKLSLSLLLLLAISVLTVSVQAASKETVYVVSSIKCEGTSPRGNESYTQKVTYNDTGLIKTITTPSSENIKETFTYDKNGYLTKYVEKIGAGRAKGTTTSTYTYKNGKLETKSSKNSEDTNKYTFYWKNGVIIKAKAESTWIDENGEEGSGEEVYRYTWKNGHIVKLNEGENLSFSYAYDKKGNLTKQSLSFNGKVIPESYYKASITYNSDNLIKKMTTQSRNPMMDKEEKLKKTVTYKKLTVNKKYADRIKAQQWQLLNSSDLAFAW